MANEKKVMGYIDCPSCGTKGGMRITHDKNGDPFGFCEATCDQQLRIGGSPRRVRAFLARFPWASGEPVTVTVTGTDAEIRAAVVAVPVTVTAAKPAPRKRETFHMDL